ncbi:hypothetical protein ON010_g18149 [Phytophthora cinnamomi]|nr:hypothetical protein ON010_g18149 [Phytophthora cinnamomi]
MRVRHRLPGGSRPDVVGNDFPGPRGIELQRLEEAVVLVGGPQHAAALARRVQAQLAPPSGAIVFVGADWDADQLLVVAVPFEESLLDDIRDCHV